MTDVEVSQAEIYQKREKDVLFQQSIDEVYTDASLFFFLEGNCFLWFVNVNFK